MISWDKTERGFISGEFRDRYEAACSIQESSLATESAIWLGVHTNTSRHAVGVRPDFNERMHLTQDMAAELWPILKVFAETGVLWRALRQCEECGALFQPRVVRQRFCPARGTNPESTCAKRAAKRRQRQKVIA